MPKTLLAPVLVVLVLLAVACSGSTPPNGIVIKAGTWSYSLREGIPTPGSRCTAASSGTTTMSADGTYSIAFPALSCSGCTMSASTSGTVMGAEVTGSVSASIAGTGCSSQQPTPNPAPISGPCDASNCQAHTADGDSFNVTYTLTPPG